MYAADGMIYGRYLAAIRQLSSGYLNDAKVISELPRHENESALDSSPWPRAAEYAWPKKYPFGGGIVAIPAIFMFAINSLILLLAIVREKSRMDTCGCNSSVPVVQLGQGVSTDNSENESWGRIVFRIFYWFIISLIVLILILCVVSILKASK